MKDSNKTQIILQAVIVLLLVFFLSALASHILGDTFRIVDMMLALIPAFLLESMIFVMVQLIHIPKHGKYFFIILLLFSIFIALFNNGILKISHILTLFLFNYLVYTSRKSTRNLVIILFAIILVFFILILNMRYTPGSFTIQSLLACHIDSRITEKYADNQLVYYKTKNNLCMTRHYCNIFKDHFNCTDIDTSKLFSSGIVPIKNINPRTFKVHRNKTRDGSKFLYYWIVDMNNKSYFMTLDKGNGRFFEIDKSSFHYLGHDLYKDKYGYVYKNTRVH